MICSNHNSEVITKWFSQEREELLQHEDYQWWYYTSQSQTKYLMLTKVNGYGTSVEPIPLIVVPGRRSGVFVQPDCSISYSAHVFSRYCERVLGYAVNADTKRCEASVEECAARFMLDTKDMPLIYLGPTYEGNRGVAVLGNHILLLNLEQENGIPMADTFISEDMIAKSVYESACVDYAHKGQPKLALVMYNLGKRKSQASI